MSINLRRSPRFINRAVPVAIPVAIPVAVPVAIPVAIPIAVPVANANEMKKEWFFATFSDKLTDVNSTGCCDCKMKKIKALFKFVLQKECITLVKSNSKLHITVLNKAQMLGDTISYTNHNGSFKNKVALIKTSKELEKALL